MSFRTARLLNRRSGFNNVRKLKNFLASYFRNESLDPHKAHQNLSLITLYQ